jgi:transglutaminase-like putative cysteine protease
MQEKFSTNETAIGKQFSYTWKDSSHRRHHTSFEVHASILRTGNTEFRPPETSPSSAPLEMLRTETRKLSSILDCNVEVSPTSQGFQFSFEDCNFSKAEMDEVVSHLSNVRDVATQRDLKKNFYQTVDTPQGPALRPDYLAIVSRYSDFASDVARALSKTSPRTARGKASHALEFIQSVPYSTSDPSGAGFQTPVGLFTQNRGDCDTKTVALVSILRSYGIDAVLVTVPGHMFAGIDLPPSPGDHTFEYRGRKYVSAEPSGLGFPLGKLAKESADHLSNGEARVVEL